MLYTIDLVIDHRVNKLKLNIFEIFRTEEMRAVVVCKESEVCGGGGGGLVGVNLDPGEINFCWNVIELQPGGGGGGGRTSS